MVVRDLIANHPHSIGHRRLVQGEVWCRLQFRDDADLASFQSLLRWSAFRFQVPQQPGAQPTPEPAPVAQPKPVEPKPEPTRKR